MMVVVVVVVLDGSNAENLRLDTDRTLMTHGYFFQEGQASRYSNSRTGERNDTSMKRIQDSHVDGEIR